MIFSSTQMDEMFWGKSEMEKREDYSDMSVFKGCKEQAKGIENVLGR